MTFSKLGIDKETNQPVYLPKTARLQGLYIIGIQGTGKSGLIENLIMEDINQQIGVCVLDPHGELIDHVIARLDTKDVDKVIFLDLANYQFPFGLNVFTCADLTNPLEVQKTVDQILHIFEKLLGVSQDTPLILEYLYNCTYTLVANPGYTMADIPMLLQNEQFRRKLVAQVTDPDVLFFWQQHDLKKPSDQNNDIASTLRRVKQFLQPLSRPIVGQATTTIDLQQIMNQGNILLVKLTAQVDSVSSLIGSLMIALLLNAAYTRPAQRRQFHLYADEFQRFATEDFATLLEEARKFGIGTTIAHQNRGQLNSANSKLETDLKDRSRSVGNMVVFKINSKDADDLAGEFDTTPPPPQPEEIGREEHLTYKEDVLNHLLHNGHEDSRVVTLAAKYLTPLEQAAREETVISSLKQNLEQTLDNIKRFLAASQRGQLLASSPSQQVLVADIVFEFCNAYNYLLYPQYGAEIAGNAYRLPGVCPTKEDVKRVFTTVAAGYSYDTVRGYGYLSQAAQQQLLDVYYPDVLGGLYWSARSSFTLNPNASYYLNNPLTSRELSYIDLEKKSIQAGRTSGWSQKREDAMLQHLKETEEIRAYQESLNNTADPVMRQRKQQAWALAQQRVANAMAMMLDLAELSQRLYEKPIMTGSGQYIKKMKPGTVRPFQDVRNDIANQLSGLPSFTARVKIGGTAPQNPGKKCLYCGKQNNSGAKFCQGCGTQLPASNEYTLTTIKPAGGIGTQQLRQRIANIQARNIREGFIRPRQDVEAEILQRQQSVQPVPAIPHVPQPQPAQRHARQVPVHGNCPTCGKSNPPGSKFCNQCGTKL